tara:strand:+ start:90 stop:212 length:123 start_codon:yes stop_codon:yes gene_type:complete
MEYIFIKIILIIGFFATLIIGAFWAVEKLEEYWGEDKDGQ